MKATPHYLPTNDLLFKRTMANAAHPAITKGLISDVLGIKVCEVEVQNPYSIQSMQQELANSLFADEKISPTMVDVLVRLEDNTRAIIEVQVEKQKYFLERTLYYVATRFCESYDNKRLMRAKGDEAKYSSLYPVYNINILKANLFDDTDPLRLYSLYDKAHGKFYGAGRETKDFGGLLCLAFLELGKQTKLAPEKVSYWMDFLNGKPPVPKAPDYLKEAYELNRQDLTKEEREMISALERAREDKKAELAYARDEGLEEGERRGLSKGRLEGLEATAKAALCKGFDLETIADLTNLDLATIKRLQSELEAERQ